MKISHFRDLEVYRRAFKAAMRIFEITKAFPAEVRFSLESGELSSVIFLQSGDLL